MAETKLEIIEFDPNSRNLIAALIRARKKFLPVVKTTKGGRGKYAPLDEVIDATLPFLLEENIFLSQPFVEDNGSQYIDTILMHVSGETFKSRLGFDIGIDWQKNGAAMSYVRRYSLLGILGLAAYDDDADSVSGANAVAPTSIKTAPPAPAKTAPAPTQSIEEMTIDQLYVEFRARCKTNGVKASEKFKELMGDQLQEGVTFADLDSDKARWLVLELPLF